MNQDSNTAIYFQCQLCGDCCSSWNIPVEVEKAEILLQKAWVQQRLQETGRRLQRQSPELYRIPLTDENVCVFLGADRRCLIEVKEGGSLKPHECKRFPFATVKAPDGTAIHDTSAACKSVSERLLLAFQSIQPTPSRSGSPDLKASTLLNDLSESWLEDAPTLPRQVRLSLFGTMDWSHLQTLRAQWRPCFQDGSDSVEEALGRAQVSLVKQQTVRQRLFQSSPRRERLILTYFLRKPYQSFSLFQLLGGAEYHDPRVFGESLPLGRLKRVCWTPQGEPLLKAFIYNLLNRNRLLAAGGSVQALLAMAQVAVVLVRWYARALAVLQNAEETSSTDVATAIRLVERYYTGHQPRFFAFFQSPWRAWLLGLLVLRGRLN